MSSDQTPPVRVRLRYAAYETFIERFAPNVTRGGVFLASRTPRPVGAVFPFEVQLAGGEVALSGEGKVVWIREYDPSAPQRPHGMGVQFVRLDAPSRDILDRMLARKAGASSNDAAAGAIGWSGRGPAPPRRGRGAQLNGGVAAVRPKIDTNVDLAAEYGIDESALRRAVERNRLGFTRGSGDFEAIVEDLLKLEPSEPATLSQALTELPRLLDPAASRRRTGAFRPMLELQSGALPAASSTPEVGGVTDKVNADADRTDRS